MYKKVTLYTLWNDHPTSLSSAQVTPMFLTVCPTLYVVSPLFYSILTTVKEEDWMTGTCKTLCRAFRESVILNVTCRCCYYLLSWSWEEKQTGQSKWMLITHYVIGPCLVSLYLLPLNPHPSPQSMRCRWCWLRFVSRSDFFQVTAAKWRSWNWTQI